MAASGRARVSQAGAGSPCADLSPKEDMVSKQLQVNGTFKKTLLCSFFARGACLRGKNCNYAHGTEEVRKKPNLLKISFCADFIEVGSCKKGFNCNFAHDTREFRGKVKSPLATAAAKLRSANQPPQKMSMSPKAHAILAEVHLPLVAHGLTRKEHEKKEKFEEHCEQVEEEGDKVLNWDPVCSGQWSMHSQPDYQQISDFKPGHLGGSFVLPVKNTFIHVLDEDALLGLPKSKSWPLLAQPPSM
eukprot:TRINITY_DN87856_c0_g1_i1.p1 TRINITY_DN87856_c0_g1~~TRINITY_DN87856_c0_g1_i1.p1  ORF type:complete len:267 (-),score=47.27 TRINITY_DN87856_c0_g1_i1:238-972(-)